MTISVLGIGWITNTGYGCVKSGMRHSFENVEGQASPVKKAVFSHPFKNFGRLDKVSKSTAYAVALALQDAGIEYSPFRKQDIGVLGTNTEGSLPTDVEYFQDYLKSGRTLSRGNLFIYTLPSSPLGESAIHFGLLGPLLYATSATEPLARLIDMASGMVTDGEASAMLAGLAEEDESIFFLIGTGNGPDQGVLCGLSEARSIIASTPDTAGMVREFSRLG